MKWLKASASFFLLLVFLFLAQPTQATSFDLLGPTETLVRGQDVRFTINIDTQNQSMTSTQVGMTYDTQYLQYLNTVPGDTFTTISASEVESGKLVINGSKTTAYSGTGTFAYVNFKLIAQAPGSTEICALFAPTSTPVPTQPTSTSAPQPTALPKSGEVKPVYLAGFFGSLFLMLTLGIFIAGKSQPKTSTKHQAK